MIRGSKQKLKILVKRWAKNINIVHLANYEGRPGSVIHVY